MREQGGVSRDDGLTVLFEALIIKMRCKYCTDSQEDDLDVLQDRIILDVQKVVTKLVLSCRIVVTCNLCKACDTCLNGKSL